MNKNDAWVVVLGGYVESPPFQELLSAWEKRVENFVVTYKRDEDFLFLSFLGLWAAQEVVEASEPFALCDDWMDELVDVMFFATALLIEWARLKTIDYRLFYTDSKEVVEPDLRYFLPVKGRGRVFVPQSNLLLSDTISALAVLPKAHHRKIGTMQFEDTLSDLLRAAQALFDFVINKLLETRETSGWKDKVKETSVFVTDDPDELIAGVLITLLERGHEKIMKRVESGRLPVWRDQD